MAIMVLLMKYGSAKLVRKKCYDYVMFVQNKPYDVHPNCYIGRLKPYVYTDGFVYPCSAIPLYSGDFDAKRRLCHWSKIREYWPYNCTTKPDTKMCRRGKCFYSEQNKLLDELFTEVDHYGFI